MQSLHCNIAPMAPKAKAKTNAKAAVKICKLGQQGYWHKAMGQTWDIIRPSKPIGQLGSQGVHLRALLQKGNPEPLNHYERLKGNKANVESALSLTLDRDNSCLNAMETHTGETLDESSVQEGWLTVQHIAML